MPISRIYTARYLLPMTSAPIEDAALLVRDGRIASVGRRVDLPARDLGCETIDFGDAILLPPLVNAHAHLELTDFPKWAGSSVPAAGSGFVDWILHLIAIKRAQTPESLAKSLRHGLEQLPRTGTGVVADILSQPDLAPVYADSALLGRVDLELIGRGASAQQAVLARARHWLEQRGEGALCHGLSPHAPYTVDPTLLTEVAELASRYRVPLTIHLAESVAEIELLRDGAGELVEKLYAKVGWPAPEPLGSPLDYLRQSEALLPHNLLIHGVQLDADTIHHLARSRASLVLCPRSNRQLGVGVAPVAALRCQGVNLALGTDSLASNDTLSLYDEMEAAVDQYAPILSAIDVLQMATIGGAIALQLDSEVGRLSVGCGAHFQVVRPERLPALSDLATFLCRGDRGGEVAHLFLHGVDLLVES